MYVNLTVLTVPIALSSQTALTVILLGFNKWTAPGGWQGSGAFRSYPVLSGM